jgi:hypothetical protein
MTELEALVELVEILEDVREILCIVLGFFIFKIFERAASKKGFL